ncbi:MAG: phosphatidylserine decarboxylase [Chlamydiales bacterium]|nr:phosphatidylserine decarboxylase [Chlamydiales bacterium]
MEKLLVYNKKLNRIEQEKVYGNTFVQLLYGRHLKNSVGPLLRLVVTRYPIWSFIYGKFQHTKGSKKKIKPFIEYFEVDASEFQKKVEDFTSFNDFFIRKLKPEKRPIDLDPMTLIAPCDGRFHVIENITMETSFMLKGKLFDLSKALKDELLAKKYEGGSMVLARLCPTDYHRFHFPSDGFCSERKKIKGKLHSVNPIAIKQITSTFWENKREVSVFKTSYFNDILMVEVGAVCVGTIHQTYTPNEKIKKGDEKGYFSFGGSSILLLFKQRSIQFDKTLLDYSKQGIEVKLELGSCLGKSLL